MLQAIVSKIMTSDSLLSTRIRTWASAMVFLVPSLQNILVQQEAGSRIIPQHIQEAKTKTNIAKKQRNFYDRFSKVHLTLSSLQMC